MTYLIPSLAALLAAAGAIGLKQYRDRQESALPGIFYYLCFVLPFGAGGFHTCTGAVSAGFLLLTLHRLEKKQPLKLVYNLQSLAVFCVAAAYCLSPLWAADKGMAPFAAARYLPLALLALTLMQYPAEQTREAMSLISLSGAVMVVVSCILLPIPGMQTYLTVNGRLSGFMQYPNTFCAFLLAGLILLNTKKAAGKWDLPISAILISGVILSGSRTGFVLLGVSLLGILYIQKNRRLAVGLALCVGVGLLLSVAASALDILHNADRYTTISTNAGTFLGRLLYYQDALPVILKNPFGLGYLGYKATQGSFQNAYYTVTFVHNGLLQMLLDIGWIPAILMTAAFLTALLRKKTPAPQKLLLLVILGHCMLDFDLQFFVFWAILLSCLDFHNGTVVRFRKNTLLTGIAVGLFVLCLWLGLGDLAYNTDYPELTRKITPFHTEALSAQLTELTDGDRLDSLADNILQKNPTSALAFSAKANAAFSRGKITDMIHYKEQAIACSRYDQEEYRDYFEKLYTALQLYIQAGDMTSANYCYEKMLSIPQTLADLNREVPSFARKIGSYQELSLPEEYMTVLNQLSQIPFTE